MTNSKKRLLIISDSTCRKTGYAHVCKNIILNLDQDKYEIAQLGLADLPMPINLPIHYYTSVKNHIQCCGKGRVIEYVEKGTTERKFMELDIFPKDHSNQKPCIKGYPEKADSYGYDSSFFVINHFKPDIVMCINDIWGLYNINHLKVRKKFKFLAYLAIDSECLFPVLQAPRKGMPHLNTIQILNNTDKIVVFTDWARNVINKTSRIVQNKEYKNIEVISHGVDINTWKPLDNKAELRQKYFNITPNDNIFLLCEVGRNQPRKRLDATLIAMKKFIDKYEKPNKKIMCYFHHSLKDELGWDMKWLAAYYGISDRCIFNEKLQPGLGPKDEELNEMMNCADAHILLTNSEGFGMPVHEACAAGIPSITTKYSAMADWGKDCLLFVKVAEYEHEPKTNHLKAVPDTDHAAHQISLLYNSDKMCREYSNKGLKFAHNSTWTQITKEKWIPLIDSIDISDLKPDRYEYFRLNHNDPGLIDKFKLPDDPINTEFEAPEL